MTPTLPPSPDDRPTPDGTTADATERPGGVATLNRGPARAAEGRAPGKRGLNKVIPILLVLIGVIVLLYPVVATNFNNIKQRQFAQTYDNHVEQAAPHELADALAAARAYNATLDGVPILDPWLTRVSKEPESGPYQAYQGQLNKFDAMARVRVPTGKIDLPVYHGTTDPILAKGAGHLYGTALPVGGDGTHAVLTSHTAFANATLFDHLVDVKEGDTIYIDVYGETLAYQVDQIKIVLPNEISDLHAEPGKDQLTLFTCTPYAVNTHRLLVRGHRVPYNPAKDVAKDSPVDAITIEPWMYGMIAGAVGGLALLGVLIAVNRRRQKRRAAAAQSTEEAGSTPSEPGAPESPESVSEPEPEPPARGGDLPRPAVD